MDLTATALLGLATGFGIYSTIRQLQELQLDKKDTDVFIEEFFPQDIALSDAISIDTLAELMQLPDPKTKKIVWKLLLSIAISGIVG